MEIDLRPGYRALRRSRRSLAGQTYLLTSSTRDRTRVFEAHDVAIAACRAFHAFDAFGGSRLIAWVLMPDHAHWLLCLGEEASLASAVNRLKSASARNVNRISANSGCPVWAAGFHDRALRSDEAVRDAARYVVLNPVRAGIVETVADYPYWDCRFL